MSLILRNIGRKINKNWIVRNLSLNVSDGECLALLGPSGCGKSSTLRLIAGLDKPDEGKILINNEDFTNVSPVDRRIGMVFQSYALFPHLTVLSNLLLGLKVRGVNKDEQRRRVINVLSILQIEDLANRLPAHISGGQRQRVALARALLRDPLVYLLDEPMSNLDAQLREELRPELRRIILNGGQPVVYVTHDQHEAMAMADRIAVLKDGILEQLATPEELYKSPASIFVASFIGRPQINLLTNEPNITTAIRPEDIYLSKEGIESKLIYKEWLGNNQLLLLETPFGKLRVLCEANIRISDNIKINWSKDKEHYFDSNSKLRIN